MAGYMDSQRAIKELEARRAELVNELLEIRSLVRGSVSEQFLKVAQKGKTEPARRGPYYVLSRSQQGRTKSERIKKKDVARVKRDVENHKRFTALCEELAAVTEQLGELEREAAASEEAVKKGLNSQSTRARK